MRRTTITNPNPSNRGPDRDRERWAALGRVLLDILARHQAAQAAHVAQAAPPAPQDPGEAGDEH